jgi:hypothetical protein
MTKLFRIAFISLALAALASPALAQDSEPPRERTFDFSGDTIDGDLMRPDGDFIDTRDFAQHTSLIRVRTEFIREIIQSAEDL